MIKFNKPNQLNGFQLRQELNAGGVKIDNEIESVSVDGNGDLFLAIGKKDESKAKTIVDAHFGIDQSELIAAQRQLILDKLGLTADEARLLLG